MTNWYETENGELIRPADVDATSSKAYVYVRKNFEQVAATQDVPAHYKWQELKIPREMWSMCESVLGHDSALDDVYAALTELAEMIVGG